MTPSLGKWGLEFCPNAPEINTAGVLEEREARHQQKRVCQQEERVAGAPEVREARPGGINNYIQLAILLFTS